MSRSRREPDAWIWIARWEEFQHYAPERDRAPAWLKTYTRQLDDDRYTDLPPRRRALLHDLRLAFARTSGRLPVDTQVLSRRTFSQVFRGDLEALAEAGLIEIVSRAVLDQRLELLYASRARARVHQREVEVEREEEPTDLPTEAKDERGSVGRESDALDRLDPASELERVLSESKGS